MYKIAILGKANTGKNTLAKMLVRQLRLHKNAYLSASYIAFADPMKEMIRYMFPEIPRKYLYGSSSFRNEIIPGAFTKNNSPLIIRQLLIDLGTRGREYDPNIWVKNFDQRFLQLYKKIVIVTDVRFRNEFDYLRDKGFYMIRLYRNTGQPEIQHISETGQNAIADEEFAHVLFNNHGLKDLKFEVSRCIVPQLHDQ